MSPSKQMSNQVNTAIQLKLFFDLKFFVSSYWFLLFREFCFKVTHNDRALCRCGIRIPSARNRCPAFDKDKCLEPMFGDVGQARTKAAMLLLMIDTTSSRTCTKPTVLVAQPRYPQVVNRQKSRMIIVAYVSCKGKKNTAKNYFSTFS